MNSCHSNIRYIISVVVLLSQFHILSAQHYEFTFKDKNLHQVIQTIESNSDFIFNYDPQVLKEYYFDGNLNLLDPYKAFETLLNDSPFEYRIDEFTVLLFQTQPKTYNICGIIVDSNSKEPLIGVNVLAENTSYGTQTNGNGEFEFSMISNKNQKIVISYVGYLPKDYRINTLIKPNCKTIELFLDKDMWNEDVVITDYIMDGISDEGKFNSYVMDYNRLSRHHSIVEHDILKTSQLLPGVSSFDESATNLQIRGSTGDQNLILWEGAPIYQPGHIFGMISAINPFSVGNVNINKGVCDPKYDNRVGGVIDISLTDSIETLHHGSAGVTLTEAHINIEAPIISEKLEVFLSGRQGINSIFNSPPLQNYTNKVFQFSIIDDQSQDAQNGSINTKQDLNFYDWNSKILFKPVDRVIFDLGYYTNSQDFKYQYSLPEDPFIASDKILTTTEALKAKLDIEITKVWTSSLSFVQSKYKSEYLYFEEEEGVILTDNIQFNDISDRSIILSNRINFSSLNINTGYDYNQKEVNYNVVYDKIDEPYFEDINYEKGSFHNFFASVDINLNKYNINGGVRVSYYVEQDRWVSTPRLSVDYKIHPKFTLKAEGGIFYQFISQLSEYNANNISIDYPLWILNTPEQELSQRAQKIAFGFKYRDQGWLFDAELFYNQIDGLSTLSPIFELVTTNEFSRGESKALGLGLLVKKRWHNFNCWVNYSLGKINYLFPDISENTFSAPNDIRHNISLVSSYDYKDFQFSIITNFHSGLPYTQPSGIETIYDEEIDENTYAINYSDINRNRLKPYSRTDLSINYRPQFNFIGKSKLELSLSFVNLWNSENVFAREYYLESNDDKETPDLAFIRKSLLQTTPLLLCRVHW